MFAAASGIATFVGSVAGTNYVVVRTFNNLLVTQGRLSLVSVKSGGVIVAGQIIVDTKVVSAFNESHVAQMIGYLAITEMNLGLLINFKNAKLEWKRVVR